MGICERYSSQQSHGWSPERNKNSKKYTVGEMTFVHLVIITEQQERPRRGPRNEIYLLANPATTIHQEHVPQIKIIPLLDNRYDAVDYENHICEH